MASSSEVANTADDVAVPGDGEEGILVAIRMRPMSPRENSRVWRVLQKHNSITQCTSSGKPLPDRIQGRSFFSYDKTFGEASTTRQVYEQTSQGIVDSVANGLNGTIFAYGQTSSGKTYTMQGAGTLQEGAAAAGGADGGIVHMAASDIFNHIEKDPERVFMVRVSFIEIYNEEVRDLLVSGDSKNNATLTVREDKRRGVFVNSNENIVTSMDSLLSVLFAGEKNRSVAATGMNERSSRSHTIFKITVESRLKQKKKDGEEEEEEDSDEEEDAMRGDDDGNDSAVRVSTLNLVDLAGSESVRHTGATGDRQKEGGKINQSLLTLSRVIGSLGQNATHVNFRDSKLTRILQPSLSGNARMAVICCATPSELYLEETRSTLQFASRAKLVKTKAQVNEIMDDRSLIKKLQRELKEARQGGHGKEALDQIKVLERKASSAECALKRMKTLILNGGVLPGAISVGGCMAKPSLDNPLFVYNNNDETIKTEADSLSLSRPTKRKSKRRYSDSVIRGTKNGDLQHGHFSSPARGGRITKLQARTEMKPNQSKSTAYMMPSSMTEDVDIDLLREALAAKSAQAANLKLKLNETVTEAEAAAEKLQYEHGEKEMHRQDLASQASLLALNKEASNLELKLNEAEKQVEAATEKLQHEHGEKEMHRLAKQDLEFQVVLLASNKELASEQDVLMEDKDNVITTSLIKIEHMLKERKHQATSMAELQALVDSLQGRLSAKEEEHGHAVQTLNEQMGCQQEYATAISADWERKLEAVVNSNTLLTNQMASLKGANEDASKLLSEKALALEEANTNIDAMKEESLSLTSQLSNEVSDVRNAAAAAEERVAALEDELDAGKSAASAKEEAHKEAVDDVNSFITQLTEENSFLQKSNDDAANLLSEKQVALEEAESDITALKEEASSATLQFSEEVSELHNAKQTAEESLVTLERQLEAASVSNTQLVDEVASLQNANGAMTEQLCVKDTALEEAKSDIAASKKEASAATSQLSEELSEFRSAKQAAAECLVVLEDQLEVANVSNTQLTDQVASLQSANAAALEKTYSDVATVKDEASSAISQLSKEASELRTSKQVAEESLVTLESQIEAAKVSNSQLADSVASLQRTNGDVVEQLRLKEAALEATNAGIAAAKEDASSAALQLSEEMTEICSAKQASEDRVTALEKSLTAEQLATQELERQWGFAKDSVNRLTKENNTSNEIIQELQSNLADTTQEKKEQATTLQVATQSLQAATDANNILQNKYDFTMNAEQKLMGNISKLETTVLQRDNELATLNESSTSLQIKVSTLSSERDELVTKVESTNRELASMQEQLSGSISEMEKLQVKMEELGAECGTAKEQVKELTSAMESSKEVTTALQQEKDTLLLKLEGAESEKEEYLNEAEAAIDDKETMLTEIVAVEAKYDLLKHQFVEQTNQLSTEAVEKKELSDEVSRLESLATERGAALSHLKSEKDLLASSLEKMKADITCFETEKEGTVAKLLGQAESLLAKNNDLKSELEASTSKYNAAELEQEKCMHELEVVTGDNEKLNGIIADLESGIQHRTKGTQSSNAQIERLTVQVSTLTQERDKLVTKAEEDSLEVSKLMSTCAALAAKHENAAVRLKEMLSERTKSDKFRSENEALVAKVKECVAQIDSERADTQMTINELNKKATDLQGSLDTCRTEVHELLSQAEKSEANYKALESEKEECLNKLRDELSTQLSEMGAKRRETVANLQNSLDEQLMNNQSNADSAVTNSLKKEIVELKSLLSSANASVGEARSAALLADQEIEDALRNLDEQEEARRIAEDKLRLAELSPRNSPARTDSEEELLREMEVLMGEKIDAESRLEQELAWREDAEDEMKKSLEEEKQLLIDDAENKMISLRDEISQLKSDLARVESDCYNTKDENADLHDKIKRVEAKAADSGSVATSINVELARERDEKNQLQGRLDRLEEQSAAFKSQVFAAKNAFEAAAQEKLADTEDQLNNAHSQLAKSRNDFKLSREMIADLNSDIEDYRSELDSVKDMASHEKEIELSKLREELAQTKLNASHLEANFASVKRDLESSKERVDRIKRHEHEKQHKFSVKAQEIIMTLKDRLAKAESAQKAAVANDSAEAEVKTLQTEVKELTRTLLDKDARIKKLEKSKITKSQIANIQKLKDERNQFKAEVKEYKQMVETLENAKPRRPGLRERTDSSNDRSQEIAKLQDDLRQCDRKLRKYVEHSERLENDKKGVIEAISSCNDVAIVDSMAEMVASLCDKLRSAEEECDALASSEGKAAEYLKDLDSLREKHTALEHKVQKCEEESEGLRAGATKAKGQSTSFQAQIKSMSTAKENIAELQSEHRHQLHHLSNENLDLGRQLKSTKKELAEAKAELNAVDSEQGGEQTEDLQGLSKFLGSSALAKRAPMESKSKRVPSLLSGSKRIPLPSSRKRFSESPMPKEDTTEKENFLNKKQKTLSTLSPSPFRSAKEKKNTNLLSGAKKTAQRTRASQVDDTPTKKSQYMLGDSEPTADVTGECNQS